MRVLMFGWEYPPYNSGGLGVACQGLSEGLAKRGVELIFVLPKKLNLTSPLFRIMFAGVPNLTFDYIDSLLYPYLTSEDYFDLVDETQSSIYGSTLLAEVKRYAWLSRAIAESQDFDLIHAHDWLSFLAGIEAKKVSKKALVVHVHATEFDRTGGSGNQFVRDIERLGLNFADRVIAVSDYTKNILIDRYNVDPQKIDVVYNGVDLEDYQDKEASAIGELKRSGYKIVLFLGRITLQKGPDYFVRAAAKVLEYDPKVVFVMAGSGDMEGKIMELSAMLGISDKIFFAGFLRGSERTRAYREADLFVMPSVSEPFGITALEAQKYGTPALISKQSGVSEILENVLKVDFWDVEEMADKILAALAYKYMRVALSKNGRLEVKNYSWQKSAEKCIDIYESLVMSH